MLTFSYFIFDSAPQNKFPGQMYLDNKDSDSDSDSDSEKQSNNGFPSSFKPPTNGHDYCTQKFILGSVFVVSLSAVFEFWLDKGTWPNIG